MTSPAYLSPRTSSGDDWHTQAEAFEAGYDAGKLDYKTKMYALMYGSGDEQAQFERLVQEVEQFASHFGKMPIEVCDLVSGTFEEVEEDQIVVPRGLTPGRHGAYEFTPEIDARGNRRDGGQSQR